MAEKTAAERVALARHPQRPNITDYIDGLFTDFFEQCGDRACREDPAILGGIALFHGRPVTVIGTRKGKTLEENLRCNFGMPGPEGYRKALRLMKQAEKFRRPIFTFIDTAGAYPGLEAEEHGQGEAIARNLFEMSRLTVPVIAVVTGEGNSGGALALAVADRVLMLENAVYAILSPEGFASILWKDAQRSGEAAELMKLTAPELKKLGVEGATASFELKFAQIRDLSKAIPMEAIVYGQLPLMITENCIIHNHSGRHTCANVNLLTDRKGERFPVVKAPGCRNEILNSKKLFLADKAGDWQRLGLWSGRLMFTTENARDTVPAVLYS